MLLLPLVMHQYAPGTVALPDPGVYQWVRSNTCEQYGSTASEGLYRNLVTVDERRQSGGEGSDTHDHRAGFVAQ